MADQSSLPPSTKYLRLQNYNYTLLLFSCLMEQVNSKTTISFKKCLLSIYKFCILWFPRHHINQIVHKKHNRAVDKKQ